MRSTKFRGNKTLKSRSSNADINRVTNELPTNTYAPASVLESWMAAKAASALGFTHIPIKASTAVALELLLSECDLEYAAVAEMARCDIGLATWLLRRRSEQGSETRSSDGFESMVRSCRSSLTDLVSMVPVLSLHPFGAAASKVESHRVHCCLTAANAELLAGYVGADSHKAYAGGLLHDIGCIPVMLGWNTRTVGDDSTAIGIAMAAAWNLPEFVTEAVLHERGSGELSQEPGRFRALIHAAHELAASQCASDMQVLNPHTAERIMQRDLPHITKTDRSALAELLCESSLNGLAVDLAHCS